MSRSMTQRDADLFLDWAADEFLAAGRAEAAELRLAHRRQAELFCDIFHALNEVPLPPAPGPRALIAGMFERAFAEKGEDKQA